MFNVSEDHRRSLVETEGIGARMLGLDGFVVLGAVEVDGELEVTVEAGAAPRGGLPRLRRGRRAQRAQGAARGAGA